MRKKTGRPFSNPSHGNIRQHLISSDHPINTNNFKVIGPNNTMDLNTFESSFIHRLQPLLNNHDSSSSVLCYLLNHFINVFILNTLIVFKYIHEHILKNRMKY